MPDFDHTPRSTPARGAGGGSPAGARAGSSLRGVGYAAGNARLKPSAAPRDPDGLMRPDDELMRPGDTGADGLMSPFDEGSSSDGLMSPFDEGPGLELKEPQWDQGKHAAQKPAKSEAQQVKDHRKTLSTIDDLMSYGLVDWAITDGEANRALALLCGVDDGALPALVHHLDKGSALSRLFDNVPAQTVKARALDVLKVFKHRKKRDHDGVRELAIRTVELQGKDPDALLGNYSKTRLSFGQFDEKIAEQDDAGNWVAKTYTGDRGYTIGITDREVVVAVSIQLHPEAGVKTDDLKARWLDGIRSKWNGQFVASNGVVSLPIRFRPLFLTDPKAIADHEVTVKAGAGRANESKFYEKSTAGTAAHEFGHMIGNPDEYDQPVYNAEGQVTGGKDAKDSVMSDHGKVHTRHFQPVLADLNKMREPTKPEYTLKPQ